MVDHGPAVEGNQPAQVEYANSSAATFGQRPGGTQRHWNAIAVADDQQIGGFVVVDPRLAQNQCPVGR
jgi:hypothetical protein